MIPSWFRLNLVLYCRESALITRAALFPNPPTLMTEFDFSSDNKGVWVTVLQQFWLGPERIKFSLPKEVVESDGSAVCDLSLGTLQVTLMQRDANSFLWGSCHHCK